MTENFRKWAHFGMTMLVCIIATYMYITGKSNVPPPAPPVIPQIVVHQLQPATASTTCPCQGCCGMATSDRVATVKLANRPLVDKLKVKLVESAVSKGASRATALEVVNGLDSGGSLLDWLLNGGFVKLLEMVMELIALFKPV